MSYKKYKNLIHVIIFIKCYNPISKNANSTLIQLSGNDFVDYYVIIFILKFRF